VGQSAAVSRCWLLLAAVSHCWPRSAAVGLVAHAAEVIQELRLLRLVELGEEPLAQAVHVRCGRRHGPGPFLGDAQHPLAPVPLISPALSAYGSAGTTRLG